MNIQIAKLSFKVKSKSIQVYVEKAADGTYWGTSQNYEGIVSTYGNSFEELNENFEQAFADNIEIAKEVGEEYADKYDKVSFDYKMDLSSFFNLFKEVNITAIAEKSELNASLVRQYKTGAKQASVQQTHKIERAIHELGRELLSIKF